MIIHFVNNSSEANITLSQNLIDDLIAWVNVGIPTIGYIDMRGAHNQRYIGTYNVYNPKYAGLQISETYFGCDNNGLNGRLIGEIQGQVQPQKDIR
jgi:hypothetical protein